MVHDPVQTWMALRRYRLTWNRFDRCHRNSKHAPCTPGGRQRCVSANRRHRIHLISNNPPRKDIKLSARYFIAPNSSTFNTLHFVLGSFLISWESWEASVRWQVYGPIYRFCGVWGRWGGATYIIGHVSQSLHWPCMQLQDHCSFQ